MEKEDLVINEMNYTRLEYLRRKLDEYEKREHNKYDTQQVLDVVIKEGLTVFANMFKNEMIMQ